MKTIVSVFFFSLFLLLNGCLEITTLIKVSSDGSGQVHETVMISKDIVQMIRELAVSMPADSGEEKEEFNLFDEDELRSQSYTFGKGVEYSSGKELSTDTKEGFLAVYNFKDLNTLIINQNPNSKIPFNAVEEEDEVQEELVKFSFSKNDASEITINFINIEDEFEAEPEDTSSVPVDSMLTDTTFNEVAKLMKDMKISLAIEPEGEITETNATHVSGNRITLFDINFNELLSNEEELDQFKKMQPQNFEEFKALVKDIPGIKVELNQPVIIKFH